MDDDFGTPEAVAVLHELATEVFSGRREAGRQLKALGGVLGILQDNPEGYFQRLRIVGTGALTAGEATVTGVGTVSISSEKIEQLIEQRSEARKRKDFKAADDLRKELLDKGIVLEDSGSTTTWRRK
jgi:cysteinyl-tRNA synthetase